MNSMMTGPGGGMMPGMGMQGGMMQHPQMSMSSRPPPPEYGMTSQPQNMPYMMNQMSMGQGPHMRGMVPAGMVPPGRGAQGNVRNPGMQQIPPSGPMMRHQPPMNERLRVPSHPGQMSGGMNPGMMMMGSMKQGMMGMQMNSWMVG